MNMIISEQEQLEIDRHATHQTKDATQMGDRKRKIFCLDCGRTFEAGTTLPDGVWAMPAYNSISVQLQLTAILKKLQGPTPADKVRLAALYALRPDYLTHQLSSTNRNEWLRLVGNGARVSDAANVISFAPRANSEWRDAYTQLRGMRALIENSENNTWAPGAAVQDFMTEGWPDGRADFVLNALEGMVLERSIALLPTDGFPV